MPTERLCIVGAGGHARVVADAALAAGIVAPDMLWFADDRPELHGRSLLGAPVIGGVSAIKHGMRFHVAIGSGETRFRLQAQLVALGAVPVTVIHPRAVVSVHASVGAGSFVAAGAIVGPQVVLGDGVIVNHNAVIDHDCQVSSWTHIAPQAALGGSVQIGELTIVGAGSTVLPGKRLGARLVVGAGSVVVRNAPEGVVIMGVPARIAGSNDR
jgi:sugar O-acyltransferase (sialic acid O-acetyltransferase NeuD family)